MQGIVRVTVFEVLFEFPTDQESVVRRDGHIASVKEAVDIGTQKKTVVDSMLAASTDRPNMSRFEHRKRLLSRDSTAALVGVDHDDPKPPLAKPRADQDWVAVHWSRLCLGRGWDRTHS